MSEASGATSHETNGGAEGGQKDLVPKADHQRVLDDMMKFKKSATEAATERDELKARLTALEKQKSESSGDFKTLAEQYQKSADEWKSKFEGLKGSVMINEKHKAASTALLKAGMSTDALKILDKEDFNEIEVEATTSGRFLVHGIDLFVDKFKKEYPFAFAPGKAPTMNTGGGNNSTTETEVLTPKRIFEIEMECKKKGDMTAYNDAIKKFAEQRNQKK